MLLAFKFVQLKSASFSADILYRKNLLQTHNETNQILNLNTDQHKTVSLKGEITYWSNDADGKLSDDIVLAIKVTNRRQRR